MDTGFRGRTARTHWDAQPWWPPRTTPPAGAPNVLLVVLDDVGFAQLGCFGSDLDTPVLDGLAANGLRYTNFHTTALCSPTRACLLTGRNHHSNGMGRVVELATGFPGYNGEIPRENGTIPEILVPRGFAAYAVGKWHLTPEDECNHAAPRGRWPLGRGFERFYGYFAGETHQFVPALVHDNHQTLPRRTPEEGYHLTEDLTDRAIEFLGDLRAVDDRKPFFLYFCPAACHSPHQAPAAWIEKYRGRFDRGWDVWREATLARQIAAGLLPPQTELSPRPEWVPAWESLPSEERRLYARYMEAFAGFLSHADHHLGRLLGFLDETGDRERTLVMVLSDNGASSEGGPTGSVNDARPWNLAPRPLDEALGRIDEIGGPRCHNNYPWGWTVAGNTPFKRWKREAHEGGVADPLIVAWPGGIRARGEIRTQFVHAIDVLPTVLAVTGTAPPAAIDGVAQRPIHGASFAASFDDAGAPSARDTQYYEMFGCRALWQSGWKAVTYRPMMHPGSFDRDDWELYHTAEDPSECHDRAADEPERLRTMIERWWTEAERHQVLPLDDRPFSPWVLERPPLVAPRARYVYWPHTAMVPEAVAVNVRNRSHRIRAEVEVPEGGADGVLVAQGSFLGGWALYVKDRRLRWAHNFVGMEVHAVGSDAPIGPGAHVLEMRFTKTAEHEGSVALVVDGAVVGQGPVPRFTTTRFSITGAGLTCGRGNGLAVTDDYRGAFPFAGTLRRVVVDVDGAPFSDPEGEATLAIATQ